MSNFNKVIRKFPRVFWVSNIMELFERWAWYGFYMSFALYLTLSKDTGALGFSQAQKAAIMGTGSMLLYFLPIITGAIADRIGFKKVLILSFTTYIIGFYMTGTFESYGAVYFAYIFLAFAGALFKPIISGMIAKTTDEETSSIGFGIFYMMVNIGGFIGPFIAGMLYKLDWNYIFLMSIITIGINYIFVFFFFMEPGREKSTVTFWKNIGQAFKNIWVTLIDYKYVLFLLIMAAFWTAFNQLYYSFPVFLEDWVDLDAFAQTLGIAPGKITAVTIGSLNAFFIILFQLFISTIAMRYKPLHAMMTGISILAIGVGIMFFTQIVWLIIFGVLIFAIGEMASSPKYTEYIGRIAPADKKALYMGTSFLPIAAGHKLAGVFSGNFYANIAEKFTLLTKEVESRGLDLSEISDSFTRTDYISMAGEQMQMNAGELTQFLWETYNPNRIWMIYSGIAISAALCLFLYDRFLIGKNK